MTLHTFTRRVLTNRSLGWEARASSPDPCGGFRFRVSCTKRCDLCSRDAPRPVGNHMRRVPGVQAVLPEDIGFSSLRLQRVTRVVQAAIDRGEVAGAVGLIARHGQVAYCEVLGVQDTESQAPMRRDAIFRIYSMTKPITLAAALMLFEECHFLLDDPAASFLPEFAKMKVFVRETATGIETADLERPVSIRHLMLHTSGLANPNPAGSAVDRLYTQLELGRGTNRSRSNRVAWPMHPCNWRSSPAAPGNTARRLLCWGTWWKWSRASRWMLSSRSG